MKIMSILYIPYRKRQLIMLSVAEWFYLPLFIFATLATVGVFYWKSNQGRGVKPDISILFALIGILVYGYTTMALPRWLMTGELPLDGSWHAANIVGPAFFAAVHFGINSWLGTGDQSDYPNQSRFRWRFPSSSMCGWMRGKIS